MKRTDVKHHINDAIFIKGINIDFMKPFDKKQPEINEENKLFYAQIGLITVRFAELESLISHIIEMIINSDDNIIASTIIEGNTLSSNLILLLKINRSRGFEEETIQAIIKEIDKSRVLRNSLVHGVWSEVLEDDGKLKIVCSNHKHIYKKISDGKEWRRYSGIEFTNDDLLVEIEKINKILVKLKDLWIALNEDNVFL
ncbi:hypothetical protein [Flavobacterium sp. LAR06]|uniref:hypothetical protein n=1 Tax=Flavobacterium sp. LAR06 TaxID=3064897 RepID=UPI0035C21C16